jgi:hypothetical protein
LHGLPRDQRDPRAPVRRAEGPRTLSGRQLSSTDLSPASAMSSSAGGTAV